MSPAMHRRRAPSLLASTTAAGGGGNKRVVGYFTQWGIYNAKYCVKSLDASGSASRLTHLNYAFGNVRNNRCEVGVMKANDPATGEGGDAFADYSRTFTAAESVDGVADVWGHAAARQLEPAEEAEGETPGPEGADLARRLELVARLRQRGAPGEPRRVRRLVHRCLHPRQPAGVRCRRRHRRGGGRVRRLRHRLGIPGRLRRDLRRQRGHRQFHRAARRIPPPARRGPPGPGAQRRGRRRHRQDPRHPIPTCTTRTSTTST